MRQMIGTFIVGVVAIVASILAIALHWPWPWWAWVVIILPCLIGGILMILRERERFESRPPGSQDAVTASGERSVIVNTNTGIVATGDDTTIER